MIAKIWVFLREPLNLALLLAIASGVGWMWHELRSLRDEPPAHAVTATTGSAATTKPSIVTGDISQNATASGDDSHAINAAPGATVSVTGSGPPK